MTSPFTRRAGSCIAASLAGFAGLAPAQTCTPEWQGQPGTPGITSGYVAPIFPDCGGVIGANGVASWDGATWQGLGSGIGTGFNPNAFAMKVFNDGSGEALYVGGRFNEIGGVPGSALIGKWDGTQWSKVGEGVFAGTFSDIETMEVFNDGSGSALYCGGWDIGLAGSGNASVAKWDGTKWTMVGQYLGGRTTSLKAWDDGSGLALFAGGTAQPGINYLAKLVNNNWDIYDGGVGGGLGGNFPSVFGLGTFGNDLYVGGNFSTAGASGIAANGLVRHTGCPASSCYPDCDASGSLNIDDFICFQTFFALGDPAADCDASGSLNIDDFICFQTFFALGC